MQTEAQCEDAETGTDYKRIMKIKVTKLKSDYAGGGSDQPAAAA